MWAGGRFAHIIAVAAALGFATVAAGAIRTDGETAAGKASRSYGAREIAALLDMEALRDAEVAAYLDTGYLHTLENLNDSIGFATTYYFDDIMNGGGAQVIDLATGRFLTHRLDVRHPSHRWGGPYVNFQQGHFSIEGAGYDPGTPTDPWGNPYYLFTPLGLVRPTFGTVTLELYGDRFDRYAIICLGADGVMSDDDLVVYFGNPPFGSPAVTTISSLAPATAAPGEAVTIRGYNFGASQDGGAYLELAGKPLPPASVVSWSDRQIVFRVPADASSGDLVVVRDAARSNAVQLRILTAVRRWCLYR